MRMELKKMLMSRTDAQVKADEALATAIQDALSAYGFLDNGEMVTEFLVLNVTQKLVDDNIVTSHPVLMKDGDMPWFKIMGIMTIHQKIADSIMLAGNDNG